MSGLHEHQTVIIPLPQTSPRLLQLILLSLLFLPVKAGIFIEVAEVEQWGQTYCVLGVHTSRRRGTNELKHWENLSPVGIQLEERARQGFLVCSHGSRCRCVFLIMVHEGAHQPSDLTRYTLRAELCHQRCNVRQHR